MTLQKLNIRGFDLPLDLTRFAMVKTFCISPKAYNECKITQFTHLNKLHIDNEGNDFDDDIKMFMCSDKMNFSEITHLKLQKFGSDYEYDFDAFCYFLSKFPNVTHLELEDIFLTEFNDNNPNIAKITPKLQALYCSNLDHDISANLFRNKLMNMYSKQLKELHFVGDIDTYSF
eukprot:389232_1